MLLVGAGSHTSTRDVEEGYAIALRAAGVDVKVYALELRMPIAHRWLQALWRARGRKDAEQPTWADTLYQAGYDALEAALRLEVDWVLVVSAMYLHPDVIVLMKRAGLRVAVLFTESPYEDLSQLRIAQAVDWCWTNERTSARTLRGGYLPHAYYPAVHRPSDSLDPEAPAHDVVFVGTGFVERCELLEAIDWTGIDLGLYGHWKHLAKHMRKYVRGAMLPNDLTINLYRKATVGLNLFRTSVTYTRDTPHRTGAESANPRTFELAACGLFQISQHRAEVADIFGSSVPTFTNPKELQSLLRIALDDTDWRLRCAQRAHERVAPHTFAARAAQVLADLERCETVLSKGA